MDRETPWFVDQLKTRQAQFLLHWLQSEEGDREAKRAVLLAELRNRSPVNGPQSALAYIVDNRCPGEIGLLAEYIGGYPSEGVIDALIEHRIQSVGSAKSVRTDLVELFEESAAVYDKFKDLSRFSAAAARQTQNLGSMLYHGARRIAERHA